MAIQQFLARIAGVTEQVLALVTSSGSADAGKIVATDTNGRLSATLLPENIGQNIEKVKASVALTAGDFVRFGESGGEFVVLKASNATGPAEGFVIASYEADQIADVYPLDGINSSLTGLTVGARYWLGTAGGVIAVPLDETDVSNKGKYSQLLGVAKSATELITSDNGFVRL